MVFLDRCLAPGHSFSKWGMFSTFRCSSKLFKLSPSLYPKSTKTSSLTTPKCFNQTYVSTTSLILKPFNSKLSVYMRNGLVEQAQKMFDKMSQRNTVTWNAMIRGYFQNRKFDHALRLFRLMPERDIISYNTVIAGLMQHGDVCGAKEVFDNMLFKDIFTWNSMISGLIRNQMVEEAIRVFNTSPEKDVVSFNLVIGALLHSGDFDSARKIFGEMPTRDIVSWTIMINGLVREGYIAEGREVFERMPVKDIRAWNAIIGGYIESDDFENAEILFQRMPERDTNSWRILIDGLVCYQRFNAALSLFVEMPVKCDRLWNSILLGMIRNGLIREAHAFLEKNPFSNLVSSTNMIVGYFETRDLGAAIKVFESIPLRDTAVWNATIFGLGENDLGEEGLKLFIRMREFGEQLDEHTFTSVLKICSDLSSLYLGQQIHGQVIRVGLDIFTAVSNATVNMYARCGSMNSAALEFCSMQIHDIISWNSIICGFARQGNGEKALAMFRKMTLSEVVPSHITFVGVLSACSHAGLIDQGRSYFDLMKSKYHIQPTGEHYTCMVDMLGRHGLIGEAMNFLDRMRADNIEVGAGVWGALLGACRLYKNIDIGSIAGEKVLEIEPYNSGVYLILAEMYMSCGRRRDAERMWTRMKERQLKKEPGCSWIELNNTNHVFLSGHRCHPQFGSIHPLLNIVYKDMENPFTGSSIYQEIQSFFDL